MPQGPRYVTFLIGGGYVGGWVGGWVGRSPEERPYDFSLKQIDM